MIEIKKKVVPIDVKRNIESVKVDKCWDTISSDDKKAIRDTFDFLDKNLIKENLLKEQHYVCAYCMKRIENNAKTGIEHLIPLSTNKEEALDYQNMYAVCDGGQNSISGEKVLCCDKKRGNINFSFITSFDKILENLIKYRKNGIIYSDDVNLNRDINELLGLNGLINSKGQIEADTSSNLIKNRRDVYNRYQKYIIRLESKRKLNTTVLSKRILELQSQEKYDEYIGVMLFFLKRKMHQLEKKR